MPSDDFQGLAVTACSWRRRLMSTCFATVFSARRTLLNCLKTHAYPRARLFCTVAAASEGSSKLSDPGTLKDFLHTVVRLMLLSRFWFVYHAESMYLCCSQILARGPLSVAEFMRHVRWLSLTHCS